MSIPEVPQRPTRRNRQKTRALARRMQTFIDSGATHELQRDVWEQIRTHKKLANRLGLPIEVEWIRRDGRHYICWIRRDA